MTHNLKHCIMLLQDNEESVKKEAQKILLKVCNNILKYPQEFKYRNLQLANSIVSTKLLPASGAIECLFEAGFIENDDGFLLPMNASLTGVKELCHLLNSTLEIKDSQSLASKDLQQPSTSSQNDVMIKPEYKKAGFFESITALFQYTLKYEDQSLQNKVKLILPLEKLQINAMKKLREIQRDSKTKSIQNDFVIEDLLLAELLEWFKSKFFTWFDSPTCKNCKGECSYKKSIASSNPQMSGIEIHECKSCKCENEFPRYTDPEVLLYTRKGRCGEWVKCFTLICRTVGFDARIVYDYTDHLWTEVWSIAHNRWIHADACENAMDRPLMYENGWGKQLTYIIACSKDEIQDVTWRYTRQFHEVLKRRNNCTETALTLFINQQNLKRQNSDGYSNARKKFIAKRRALELSKMLLAPPGFQKPSETNESESDYEGRTSGSLAWRLARGEINDLNYNKFQWRIPQGISSFEFVYCIVNDTYTTRDVTNDKVLERKENWQNGIQFLDGVIFRKEETDWKMVYLARSPESITAKITWSFEVEDSINTCVDSIKLQALTKTFHEANIKWEIEGLIYLNDTTKEKSKVISILDSENFETKDLKGAIKISIAATLYGGEGEQAWQHAQLFRQSLNTNSEQPSMILRIDLLNRIVT